MTPSLRKSLTLSAIIVTALGGATTGGLANDWAQYAQVGNWTINSYMRSEAAGDAPSCSAVVYSDHINAFRIARMAQGYVFGLNGLSRDEQGQEYDLSFWFDHDQSNRVGGMAQFAYDEAYAYDDWLSHYQYYGDPASITNDIATRSSISFAYPHPYQDGEVVSTFALAGSFAALSALEDCYKSAFDGETGDGAVSDATSDCADDGQRLPISGLCQGRAINYLGYTNEPGALSEGCEWVTNEASMPGGDVLLYLAAKCGGTTSQLEVTGGAHSGTLSLVRSALTGGPENWDVAKIFDATGMRPEAAIMLRASEGMGSEESDKCEAVKFPAEYGYGPDAYQVDYSADFQFELRTDEPNWVCGEYGRNDESAAFWRVFGDFAWYFDLGQDAWIDFDPSSLTVLTADELGR